MDLPVGIVALGLVMGALAGINSMGFVLLWRTTRVVNLAQPSMGLVGGVFTGLLVGTAGWSFWWAAPIGIAAGALLGLLADRLVMFRLAEMPRTVLLVATVGLAQVFTALRVALPFAFGSGRGLPVMDVDLGFNLTVGFVLLRGAHLLTLFVFPFVVVALWWFLHHTRTGVAACALGQDDERARTLGVSAPAMRAVAWSLAGVLSGIAGVLSLPVLGLSLGGEISSTVLLLALAPAVLAGLRNIWVTAVAALALGVAYNLVLYWVPSGGRASLVLVAALVGAIALRRRRFGRDEHGARTASWAAAVSPRPLPWAVTGRRSYRTATVMLAVVAATAAAIPPMFLSPSSRVLYATSATFALVAVAVAVAWMFAGEVALGHWGLAGFGAAVAMIAPGPLVLKILVAVALMGVSGAGMAFVARRQSGLSFAVLGLAAAVAAPVAVLSLGQRPQSADPAVVGAVAAALAVLAAAGMAMVRGSRLGVQMVSGRDDPMRSPWLGVDPLRGRMIGLGLSGALAGLAGALYLAAVPAGLAPGAFDAPRSLDVLAMAIIGGLGTPIGALLGAGGLKAAEILLPGAWASLASGAGIILVMMFMPAGLGRWLESVRNVLVKLFWGVDVRRRDSMTSDGADTDGTEVEAGDAVLQGVDEESVALVVDVPRTDRIAGSDTREALQTPTVRAAMAAAALIAGPGFVAIFGGTRLIDTVFGVRAGMHGWVTASLVGAAAAGALLVWRGRQGGTSSAVPLDLIALLTAAVLAAYIAVTGDLAVAAGLLPVLIVVMFGVVGDLAHRATAAVVADVRSAAAGLVVVATGLGVVGAAHLGMVAAGSGVARTAGWSVPYLLLAARWVGRTRAQVDRDIVRANLRSSSEVLVTSVPSLEERGEPALSLQGVTVTFGGAEVLQDVSLDAYAGQLLALVGGNGAGKSTLLRVAAGFVVPDRGRVCLLGEDITGLRPEERSATGIAFVSGSRPVFPDLTVMENLRVGAYRTHRTKASFRDATTAVLDLVPAVARRAGHRAALLSGGEQRLLAIAQTLYRRPAVLIADEVTLGLDLEARLAVLDVLRSLADDGVAVIAVDHDLPALLPRSDRALLLSGGESLEFDDPSRLLSERADLLPATFLAKAIG
jgi:ABC-type branched-subunit amino acid transport system ATPase component/ABC-type branched-subunit amino acid transport system permease subunit